MGRSGIGLRPGAEGIDGIDGIDGVGDVGDVGDVDLGSVVMEHAATKAISAAIHSVRRVGPSGFRSGWCSFGKGAQPGFKS